MEVKELFPKEYIINVSYMTHLPPPCRDLIVIVTNSEREARRFEFCFQSCWLRLSTHFLFHLPHSEDPDRYFILPCLRKCSPRNAIPHIWRAYATVACLVHKEVFWSDKQNKRKVLLVVSYDIVNTLLLKVGNNCCYNLIRLVLLTSKIWLPPQTLSVYFNLFTCW